VVCLTKNSSRLRLNFSDWLQKFQSSVNMIKLVFASHLKLSMHSIQIVLNVNMQISDIHIC